MPEPESMSDDPGKGADPRRNANANGSGSAPGSGSGKRGKRGGYSGSLEASVVPPPMKVPSGPYRQAGARRRSGAHNGRAAADAAEVRTPAEAD
jgi:hypothetical protein